MRSQRKSREQQPHSVVYLLHFSDRYHHAGHYVGWSEWLERRLAHHRQGTGARLTAAVSAAGIDLVVARVWDGADRAFERRLHNLKNNPKLCPICAGEHAWPLAGRRTSQPRTARHSQRSSCR